MKTQYPQFYQASQEALACPSFMHLLALGVQMIYLDYEQADLLLKMQTLIRSPRYEAQEWSDEDRSPLHCRFGSQPPWLKYSDGSQQMPAAYQRVAARQLHRVQMTAFELLKDAVVRQFGQRRLPRHPSKNCFLEQPFQFDIYAVWAGFVDRQEIVTRENFTLQKYLAEWRMLAMVVEDHANAEVVASRLCEAIEINFMTER